MDRGVAPLALTDVGRLAASIGVVAVATTMVVRGHRPDAELAGLLETLGLGLGAVTVPYLVVTVLALGALARRGREGTAPTRGLAVVDVAVGSTALVGWLSEAAVAGPGSALFAWGAVPLGLGFLTLLLARRARRTPDARPV